VELAQVPLLVLVNLYCLRMTRISTEWSVKQLTWKLMWVALTRRTTWCYLTPDFKVGVEVILVEIIHTPDAVLPIFAK